MRVGFIGLGAMGRGMAGTLLSTGHEVTGFDLNPEALDWLEQTGGARASSAAEACAEAVRFINDMTGASSIRLEQPFERHFRDAHVLLQHTSKSSARYASAGRLMFGLGNDWVWLSF